MTLSEIIAKLDSLARPVVSKLPPDLFIPLYSNGRKYFLNKFFTGAPSRKIEIPNSETINLWGIDFGMNLFNAAGIFKDGRGYDVVVAQGAGAYSVDNRRQT